MAAPLPRAFLSRMQAQLGSEFAGFLEALEAPPPTAVRLHPVKYSACQEFSDGVKWYTGGRYMDERPVFTLDPAFHAGAYYPQEASSMLVGTALQQWMPSGPLLALDLAAAPGGKSTLLAELLSTGSLLVANEVIRSRYQVLRHNLLKWGYPAVVTSNHDPRDFHGLEGLFDLVLLDAPCSGEGLFRKDSSSVEEWSSGHAQYCSLRQRRILSEALPLLRPGGLLLYSTCTYNPAENQEQVGWLQQNDMRLCPLQLDPAWGIVDTGRGYQCYPHRVAGEGFFLAVLRKEAGSGKGESAGGFPSERFQKISREVVAALEYWLDASLTWAGYRDRKGRCYALPQEVAQPAEELLGHLKRSRPLLELGQHKGNQFVPAAGLAFSLHLSKAVQRVELSRPDALRFLKKELPRLEQPHTGWGLASYTKLGIGWFKGLPNRINNYYPTAWRIRMDLP